MRFQWFIPILASFVAFASYFDFRVLPVFLTCWNLALLNECVMDPTISSSAGGAVSGWLQGQFNKLYDTSTEEGSNLESRFSEVFSSGAKIVKNHETMSLESFKEQLQQSQFAVQGVEIEWRNVSKEKREGDTTTVKGSFVVKRYLKFRIRVGSAERVQSNSFSAK
ncbi:hypothetical protein H1R20_g12180, partial [Candolleomyces eurysporus]